MTFREIIGREEQNTDSIWLYREGMFMKAYERSAFFAHTLIHAFKLSKRYIKTVNMDVISLGFPEQTIPKWLNGYVYEWVQVPCSESSGWSTIYVHVRTITARSAMC